VCVYLSSSLRPPPSLACISCISLLGTSGYFAEKDVKGAIEFCQRKMKFLKAEAEKIQNVVGAKQSQHMQVSQVLQYKKQAMAAAAAKQQQAGV